MDDGCDATINPDVDCSDSNPDGQTGSVNHPGIDFAQVLSLSLSLSVCVCVCVCACVRACVRACVCLTLLSLTYTGVVPPLE
eukprot:COSAG02_NODE_9695_length_2138_cov_2.597842_3_plen_82_part_00